MYVHVENFYKHQLSIAGAEHTMTKGKIKIEKN